LLSGSLCMCVHVYVLCVYQCVYYGVCLICMRVCFTACVCVHAHVYESVSLCVSKRSSPATAACGRLVLLLASSLPTMPRRREKGGGSRVGRLWDFIPAVCQASGSELVGKDGAVKALHRITGSGVVCTQICVCVHVCVCECVCMCLCLCGT